MGRMYRRPVSVTRLALAGVLAFMLVPGAASAGTLDQQQPTAGDPAGIVGPSSSSPQSLAQTFTAGLSGLLDQVDLFLDDHFGPPSTTGPLTVEIRDTTGGFPGSIVLASASVPESSVPTTPAAFVAVTFAAPATVSAGVQYAIVAYTGGFDVYNWWTANADVYAGGQACRSLASPPGPWSCFGTVDLAFRTYVAVPPALPTTKEDCTNGGWQNYGGKFKNQGDCVSFVASGGNNPPANP